MTAPRPDPTIAFIVGVIGIASFSGMDAVMKGLVLAIGAHATMLWRSVIAVGLSGALYLPRHSGWPGRAVMRIHLGRGLLTTIMSFLFFWGLARVPLAQGVALSFIAPLIALYLAAVMLREEVGTRTVGASLVAAAGVLVIFAGQARADLGREATLGSIAVLVSAVCYALNIILMRRQALVAGPLEIAFFQSVTVALLFVAIVPLSPVMPPTAALWPALLLAAALGIASLLMLSWAYARAQASYLATTEYTAFLWAALFGWLVFAEPVSLFTLAGAALIVAGCILAARRPADASPALEAAA
jgi:S-adenosylmethionine uptake transporter